MNKNFKLLLNTVTFFSDCWVLAKNTLHCLARVDCVIKMELNFILTVVYQEETNRFWNSVSNVSNNKIEVMIYPHSEFSDEDAFRVHFSVWILLILSNNAGSAHQILVVICKEIALLGLNNILHNFFCFISFLL